MRAARELAVDQSLVKRHCIGSTSRMRSVSRDLNRVLVPVMMVLLEERRERGLLDKTLRRAATEIEYSRHARVHHHGHHIKHILNHVEHETVLLLESRARNPDRQTTVSNRRTEDRHLLFVG